VLQSGIRARLIDLKVRLKDCKKLNTKTRRPKDCSEIESSMGRGCMHVYIVLNKCMLLYGYMSYV